MFNNIQMSMVLNNIQTGIQAYTHTCMHAWVHTSKHIYDIIYRNLEMTPNQSEPISNDPYPFCTNLEQSQNDSYPIISNLNQFQNDSYRQEWWNATRNIQGLRLEWRLATALTTHTEGLGTQMGT